MLLPLKASQLSGYVPPGYNALRTTLLKKEKSNIENLLEPIKKTWNEKGVTIYSDGWSECGWISRVSSDVSFVKNFIMNHTMRLSLFNNHCKLKLLSMVDTRFASTIVMLKRFKTIKRGLDQLVISEE